MLVFLCGTIGVWLVMFMRRDWEMVHIQGRKSDDTQVTGGSENFVDEYLDRPVFQSLHGIAVTPRSYRKMELLQPGETSKGGDEQLEVCNT